MNNKQMNNKLKKKKTRPYGKGKASTRAMRPVTLIHSSTRMRIGAGPELGMSLVGPRSAGYILRMTDSRPHDVGEMYPKGNPMDFMDRSSAGPGAVRGLCHT